MKPESHIVTQEVDLHSLTPEGDCWQLRCYQNPSVLTVRRDQPVLVSRLQTALEADKPVKLTWDPQTLVVTQVQ